MLLDDQICVLTKLKCLKKIDQDQPRFFGEIFHQGIQYLRFLVLVLSTFGIGIGIGIESIPGLVNGIDPIVNWY